MADGTLIDTNVLLDVVTDDPAWATWSIRQMDAASLRGALVINDIVYAEMSVRFERIEDFDELVRQAPLEIAPIPRAALFRPPRYSSATGPAAGPDPAYCRIF